MSKSCLTTSITKARGLMVSRLLLGICRTKLIVVGTAVTILAPLSTRRFSHRDVIFVTSSLFIVDSMAAKDARGAKIASCELVVKIQNPDVMVKEVVCEAKTWLILESSVRCSLPDAPNPM